MNPLILTPLLQLGGKLVDRIFPDKLGQARERAEADLALRQLALEAEDKIAKNMAASDAGQVEINKVEAASSSLFKSGWRPATGWVCVGGLFYQFIGLNALGWAAAINGLPAPPELNTTDLVTLLMGLLGLGAFRTYEKRNGVA